MSRRAGRRTLVAGALAITAGAAGFSGVAPVSSAEPPVACIVDTTDVVGWWRGEDDVTGQVGPDLTGTVQFSDGVVRRAMLFDGASALTTSAMPVVADAVTVEGWVKPVTNGLVQTLVSRWDELSGDDTTRSFTLMLGPAGELVWMTDEISTQRPDQLVAVVPQLLDGDFHHVAATWDLTHFRIYVDGALVAERPSQGLPLNAAPATTFRLGARTGIGDPFHFTGEMDEMTVWRRAVSAAEVGAIHGAGVEGKCTFVPTQRAKLLPPAGTGNGWFGFSVGVDGTSVVVGAPLQYAANVFSGAAFVFTRGPSGWTQQQRLVASDAGISDQLGWSVAIDGDTVVAGSYGNNGGGTDSGAAYVFTRTAGVWTQQAKLLAADAAPGDGFGYAVAVAGDTIVVGAPGDDDAGSSSGAAYVFTRTGTTWTQQAKLVPADAAALDNHGAAVALHGDTVVVGSPGADRAGVNSGAAYVSVRSAGVWTQQAQLTPPDAAEGDQFGASVDVDVDSAVVGSPFRDVAGGAGGIDGGIAHVFTRDPAGVWTVQSALSGADTTGGDRFGVSVGIDGATVVVGAYQDSGALSQSGSAYVFDRDGAAWSQLTKIEAADAGAGDRFGGAVAISGNIVVGAYLDDDSGGNSGGAYVFAP